MHSLKIFAAAACLACSAAAVATPADPVLEAVVAGDWRKADDRARDGARHPVESLAFWGLKPGMTILEVQPGGGWCWFSLWL